MSTSAEGTVKPHAPIKSEQLQTLYIILLQTCIGMLDLTKRKKNKGRNFFNGMQTYTAGPAIPSLTSSAVK